MRSIITLNAIHLASKFVKLKDRHLCVSEVKLATKSSVNPRINLPVRSSTERGSVGDAGTKPIVQSITQAILQACVELITKLVTNRVTKLIVEKRRETPCVITNPTRDDCLANVNYRLRSPKDIELSSPCVNSLGQIFLAIPRATIAVIVFSFSSDGGRPRSEEHEKKEQDIAW